MVVVASVVVAASIVAANGFGLNELPPIVFNPNVVVNCNIIIFMLTTKVDCPKTNCDMLTILPGMRCCLLLSLWCPS